MGKSYERLTLGMHLSDPQTDVAPGRTRGRNVRSKNQCSMCPAIHTKSRSWLRSSSTREPSDPLLRVVFYYFGGSGLLPYLMRSNVITRYTLLREFEELCSIHGNRSRILLSIGEKSSPRTRRRRHRVVGTFEAECPEGDTSSNLAQPFVNG